MKLTAALQYEAMREDPACWDKMYLNKDGKFFHAYGWSAWLLKIFVCSEEAQKSRGDAKAARTTTKDGEYVMAGFPVESLGKYVPEYKSMEAVDDSGDVIFEVALPDDMEGKTYEELTAMYGEWYESCPVRESKKSKQVPSAPQMAVMKNGMFNIISQVLSYPIEQRTPAENAAFIGSLKSQAVALL